MSLSSCMSTVFSFDWLFSLFLALENFFAERVEFSPLSSSLNSDESMWLSGLYWSFCSFRWLLLWDKLTLISSSSFKDSLIYGALSSLWCSMLPSWIVSMGNMEVILDGYFLWCPLFTVVILPKLRPVLLVFKLFMRRLMSSGFRGEIWFTM